MHDIQETHLEMRIPERDVTVSSTETNPTLTLDFASAMTPERTKKIAQMS